MAIELTFCCDGCDRKEAATTTLRNKFHSFNGKGYGYGTYKITPLEEITPKDWVAFDPYTQCTYCPTCWAEIVGESCNDNEIPSNA